MNKDMELKYSSVYNHGLHLAVKVGTRFEP